MTVNVRTLDFATDFVVGRTLGFPGLQDGLGLLDLVNALEVTFNRPTLIAGKAAALALGVVDEFLRLSQQILDTGVVH
jgi:hypothetical protein